jgi:UDP-glucose 4-epimerase
MRVLVTGGAGFIGSHTVARLLAEGHSVRVLDDLSTGKRENLAPFGGAVEFLEGDITDVAAVERAVTGMDAVMHLAAVVSVPVSVERTAFAHAVNATGTLNVLEAARRAGVRRVAYASSAAVYGAIAGLPAREEAPLVPTSPYGSQKRYNEETARLATELHGLETVGLRYFNVYGPRQDPRSPYSGVLSIFIDRILGDQPVTIHGDGLQTRDFVFVGDVARANVAALTSPGGSGRAFNVGTGTAVTVLEAYRAIARSVGRDVEPAFGPGRAGDIRHSRADVGAIARELGWRAEVAFEGGIGETIAWRREG